MATFFIGDCLRRVCWHRVLLPMVSICVCVCVCVYIYIHFAPASFLQATCVLMADCYFYHVDPSPVDYHQVSFRLFPFVVGVRASSIIWAFFFVVAIFFDAVSDSIVTFNLLCLCLYTLSQNGGLGFIAGFAISAFYVRLFIIILPFVMPPLSLSAVRKRLWFSRLGLYSHAFPCLSSVNDVTSRPSDCKWLQRLSSSAFRLFLCVDGSEVLY